ncbi:hypothetical protein PMIN03_003456 [Paraphaeosphaeria minitans]
MDTDASNDSIDHGHADQFLTEEELLDFRGSTYLLSITNAVGGGQAKQFAPERPPVNAKDRLYRKLASACDLHVRHNEVIALTCPNLDGRLKDIFTIYVNEYETAQEEDLEDENVPQSVFVAANQRDDDRGDKPQAAQHIIRLDTTLITGRPEDIDDSLGAYIMRITLEAKKRGNSPRHHKASHNTQRI